MVTDRINIYMNDYTKRIGISKFVISYSYRNHHFKGYRKLLLLYSITVLY